MFKRSNFCHVASNNRNNVKAGLFVYRTTDDLATVTTSGYFNEMIIDVNLHDIIIYEQVSSNNSVSVTQLVITQKTLDNIQTTAISGDGSAYTAGTGIDITGTTISNTLTDTGDLTNGAGFITGIDSTDVTTALGFTPADASALATVATTGDYDDLLNKPTIPTVNDATITITQGGVTKGSFTLNQSADASIEVDASGSTYTAGTGLTLSGTQFSANVVTSVDSLSTDNQIPSAKLFYDTCGDIETLINAL
mgnify:CR=1 FL=1